MTNRYVPKGCKSCKYKAVMCNDPIDGNVCVLDDFSGLEPEDVARDERPDSCPFNLEEDPLKDKYSLVKKSNNKAELISVGTYDECVKYRAELVEYDDESDYIIEKLEQTML